MTLSGLPIALDAMGGDKAPNIVVKGARLAKRKHPELTFIFYGDEEKIAPLLQRDRFLKNASEIVHTDERVYSDEKPSSALRRKPRSSMRLAIEAVRDGKASGVVSAGNTGAFMAMSKMVLKTLPGILRPAIATTMPTNHKDVILLDLGANVSCDSRAYYQFAVMGDAYARAVLGSGNPRIGLLNIGSEEIKGHEDIQQAAQMLKEEPSLNFIGFVEADEILTGEYDVIVTDGFTGNNVLKAIEGTASFFYRQLKLAIRRSLLGKMGYLLLRPALFAFKKRFDPRRYNGAMFLGLGGIAVKSHGGADSYAFSHAIREAYRLVNGNINQRIIEEFSVLSEVRTHTEKKTNKTRTPSPDDKVVPFPVTPNEVAL